MTFEEALKLYKEKFPVNRQLTREEKVDWAYGNVVLHNPNITREIVEKAYDRLYGDKESSEENSQAIAT